MNLYVYALIASILFFLLTPGTVLTIPPQSGCGPLIQLSTSKSCATSYTAAIAHTLVFLIAFTAFIMWRKTRNSNTYKYLYAAAAAGLFFVLTPGIILTLPPTSGCGPFIQLASSKSCATSYTAVAVHTLLFLIILTGTMMYGKNV
jgi:hypothetical protein